MDASAIPTRFAIVTGDDNNLQNGVGIIFAGGTCAIVTSYGDVVTLPAAFAGMVLPIQIKQVKATGTTATAIGIFR